MNKFTLPVLCLGLAQLSAQVILNETFAYPDGRLTNVSGGLWVNNSGTAPLNVTNGSAILRQLDTSSREDAYRGLSTTFNPATDNTSTIYGSFTISYTILPTAGDSDGSYFAHLRSSANGLYGRIGATTAGAAPGSYRLGIANGTWSAAASIEVAQDLALNTSYQVVFRFDLATDQATLWVNPVDESSPGATATDTFSYSGVIDSFGLRQGTTGTGRPGELNLDDLIIGQTFADVTTAVPEPSMYAFIGLGLAGFYMVRRLRRK